MTGSNCFVLYFPNEYTGSAYTYSLKGANIKAKANAVQGIPEMIEIATGGNYKANEGEKFGQRSLVASKLKECIRDKDYTKESFANKSTTVFSQNAPLEHEMSELITAAEILFILRKNFIFLRLFKSSCRKICDNSLRITKGGK